MPAYIRVKEFELRMQGFTTLLFHKAAASWYDMDTVLVASPLQD